jgi:hypothetical protein
MSSSTLQSKPKLFDVFTRIAYVHQAFSLAVLGSGLASLQAQHYRLHVLSTGAGLLIAVATIGAMFRVAKQKSSPALTWLRVLLWAAVARGLLSVLTLSGDSDAAIVGFVRSMILNEAIMIPLAIYWSRAVHGRYLASLRDC